MNLRQCMLAVLIPCALASHAASAADEVFKWRDDNGRWQYGNQPPPGVKGERVLTTISTVPAYKPKSLKPAQTSDTNKPSEPVNESAAGPSITGASRQQMMDACQKAGGTDCDAVVNAALNASVGKAVSEQDGSGKQPVRQPKDNSLPASPPAKDAY